MRDSREDQDKEHGLTGFLAMEQEIAPELIARRIAPGVAENVPSDALAVVADAFRETETDAVGSMQDLFEMLIKGQMIRPIESFDCTDCGRYLEALGVFVYYNHALPVGIGGAYRYLDLPQEFWLSRLGVAPEARRQGLGKIIVEHACNLVKQLGGSSIKVFTQDIPGNVNTHRFYEAIGFQLTGESFLEKGLPQRVYLLSF